MSMLTLAASPTFIALAANAPTERKKLLDLWDKNISPLLTGATNGPQFWTILGVVGAVLIIGSFITYLMKRRNGSGGDNKGVIWTAAFGTLCLGPTIVIPLVLRVFDFAIDIFVGVLKIMNG